MDFSRKTDEKIGEILLKEGVISKNQLQEALERQNADGGLIGEVMIKLGFVTDRDIAVAVISQYGFPFMPLESYSIDESTIKLIPGELARKHRTIPLDLIGDVLVVAMANPLDEEAIEEIEKITGKKVKTFISVISAIADALDKIYP